MRSPLGDTGREEHFVWMSNVDRIATDCNFHDSSSISSTVFPENYRAGLFCRNRSGSSLIIFHLKKSHEFGVKCVRTSA